MAKDKSNINRITFLNILSTVLLKGISLFTAPIISRLLGADNYGISSIYITWVVVFMTCFGLQTNSTFNIAKSKYPASMHESYQSSMIALSLFSFLAASILTLSFIKPMSLLLKMSPVMIILMLINAYGMFCVDALNVKNVMDFRAGRNLTLSLTISISTILFSILFILYIPKEINYWGRISAMSLIYGIAGVVITVDFFKKGKCFFSKEFWHFCLPLSVPIIFHGLANIVLEQSDRIMVQRIISNNAAGIYSLVASFASVMSAIWAALNNSWSPFFYEYARNNQVDEIKEHGKNYIELFTGITVGFMLLTPEVFRIFASQSYWSGMSMIPLLVMGFYFVFLYSFSVNHEFFNCQTKVTAIATVISGSVNVILNLIFISWLGTFGAALATMISHGLQFLIHHIAAVKLDSTFEYPFSLRMIAPYVAITFISALVMTAAPGNWIIRWVIGASIGAWLLYRICQRKSIF